jgi:hypothetical protein
LGEDGKRLVEFYRARHGSLFVRPVCYNPTYEYSK